MRYWRRRITSPKRRRILSSSSSSSPCSLVRSPAPHHSTAAGTETFSDVEEFSECSVSVFFYLLKFSLSRVFEYFFSNFSCFLNRVSVKTWGVVKKEELYLRPPPPPPPPPPSPPPLLVSALPRRGKSLRWMNVMMGIKELGIVLAPMLGRWLNQ